VIRADSDGRVTFGKPAAELYGRSDSVFDDGGVDIEARNPIQSDS
jgi:hypothetical protein